MGQAENPWGGLCAQAKMALPRKITTLVHLDWDITKLKVLMTTQKNQGQNRSLFFKAMVNTMSILQNTTREKCLNLLF